MLIINFGGKSIIYHGNLFLKSYEFRQTEGLESKQFFFQLQCVPVYYSSPSSFGEHYFLFMYYSNTFAILHHFLIVNLFCNCSTFLPPYSGVTIIFDKYTTNCIYILFLIQFFRVRDESIPLCICIIFYTLYFDSPAYKELSAYNYTLYIHINLISLIPSSLNIYI